MNAGGDITPPGHPIVLLTDFGVTDWFAGEMKGAILSIAPHTVIVDLTHCIATGDLLKAAFTLLASYRSFPPGSIFIASVSYGNTKQDVIAAHSDGYTFLGPDNGILSWVLNNESEVRQIEIFKYIKSTDCATFPARDLLCPLAARLSQGLPFSECGPVRSSYTKLDLPPLKITKENINGSIIYIDCFGNAITSIPNSTFLEHSGGASKVNLNQMELYIGSHYSEVSKGELLVYPGSAGFIEIGANEENAAERLKLKTGSEIQFKRL